MNTEDKAKELYNRYAGFWHDTTETCKRQCIIALDEIINETDKYFEAISADRKKYWQEVKEHIQNLK